MSNKTRSGQIGVITTAFSERLSAADDDVQKALDTLDADITQETVGGTGISSYTTGDILYSDGYNSLNTLPIGTDTYVLTSNGTTPHWASLDTEDAIDLIKVGKIDIISPNTTVYLLPDFSESNNEDFIAYLIDGYGTLSDMQIYAGTASGVGDNIVFTVRINGVDTSLTATLSDASTTVTGSSTVNVSPGDLVTVSAVTSATCAAADIYVSIRYGESLIGSDTIDIITAGKIGAVTANATRYLLPNYAQSTTEVFPAYMVTDDGYIDNLRIHANTAPGIGQSAVVTFRIGGADTLLTSTISGADTDASDLTTVIGVNSGDKGTIKIVTSAGCAIADVFVSMRYRS